MPQAAKQLEKGRGLRRMREERRLTLKEVEEFSQSFATARRNTAYTLTAGRLSQVEKSDTLLSAYKLVTLSRVYKIPFTKLLRLYGIKPYTGGRLS